MFVGFSLDFKSIQSKVTLRKQHFVNHLNRGQLCFLLIEYLSRAKVQAASIFLDLFNSLYFKICEETSNMDSLLWLVNNTWP